MGLWICPPKDVGETFLYKFWGHFGKFNENLDCPDLHNAYIFCSDVFSNYMNSFPLKLP